MKRVSELEERCKLPPSATGLLRLDYEVPEFGTVPPVLPPVANAPRIDTTGPTIGLPVLPSVRARQQPQRVANWLPIAAAAITLVVVVGGLGFLVVRARTEIRSEQAALQKGVQKSAISERDTAETARVQKLGHEIESLLHKLDSQVKNTFDRHGQVPILRGDIVPADEVCKLPMVHVVRVIDGSHFIGVFGTRLQKLSPPIVFRVPETSQLADDVLIERGSIRFYDRDFTELAWASLGALKTNAGTYYEVWPVPPAMLDDATERFISKRPGANPLDLDSNAR